MAHLGPGPARDVLAALLNGTHFNYVMLGSPAHPDSVERLILTSNSGGVPDGSPSAPAAQSPNQFQVDEQGVQGHVENDRDDGELDESLAKPLPKNEADRQADEQE